MGDGVPREPCRGRPATAAGPAVRCGRCATAWPAARQPRARAERAAVAHRLQAGALHLGGNETRGGRFARRAGEATGHRVVGQGYTSRLTSAGWVGRWAASANGRTSRRRARRVILRCRGRGTVECKGRGRVACRGRSEGVAYGLPCANDAARFLRPARNSPAPFLIAPLCPFPCTPNAHPPRRRPTAAQRQPLHQRRRPTADAAHRVAVRGRSRTCRSSCSSWRRTRPTGTSRSA